MILSKRNIFTDRLLYLIDHAEKNNSLTGREADDLLFEALKIFGWHSTAIVRLEEYVKLNSEHPMVADIASFPSAHINHLTPRTLDIDLVQKTMVDSDIPAKERIEGPPRRKCEILLRQTSFKALEESVRFYDGFGTLVDGSHTARFGEVEQRRAAVTRKGRDLYDKLLLATNRTVSTQSPNSTEYEEILQKTFDAYPDDWADLRAQGLIFVRYKPTPQGLEQAKHSKEAGHITTSLSRLIELGLIEYEPITYEDFLPFSAAGIFTSNVSNGPTAGTSTREPEGDRRGFESSLGVTVLDELALYEQMQMKSIEECRKALKAKEIVID
jgi:uncharacterized glyoxalase superfamily metalloenzyme YdcJ